MNQPDTVPQPGESQKTACAEMQVARTLASEQLRQYLNDRRNRLRKERSALLEMADRLKNEIAAYDQLLAELTI